MTFSIIKKKCVKFRKFPENVKNFVFANGFNRNFNVRSKFGKGVYFARDASYSIDYCTDKNTKYLQTNF